MKTATVSFRSATHDEARPLTGATVRLRFGGGLLGLASVAAILFGGCKSAGSGTATSTRPPTVIDGCAPNVGNTSGNAVAITSGQSYQNKVCFEGTSNWYVVTVPAGSTLLDVAAGYPYGTVSPVDLDVKVYFQSSATTLTQLEDLTAPQESDAGINSIHTTVLASQSGTYYVQASAANGTAFDATHPYTISVTSATDPDSHEPNDTTSTAKAADSNGGYLAYLGDLDIFTTSLASASDLLSLTINNPKTAKAAISYQITTSGTVVASGTAPPAATAFSSVLPVAAAGDYYVTLSYPAGATPDRSTGAGYTVSFASSSNPDTTNNHSIATAVCPGGGSGPCTMAYAGTAVTLPSATGYIATQGQHDYYRIDVTSGAPLVLQMNLTSAASTSVEYSVDLLTPDPSSSCKLDSDCTAINHPCASADDCELSHACLAAGNYGFCPTSGVSCKLCEGAGLCIPTGSATGVCAVSQYLSAFTAGGTLVGGSSVSTAQPLFQSGAYYLNVHDVHYTNVDEKNPYTLALAMVPEPDPYDQSPTASSRNNFYDPYPSSKTDLSPSAARAVDITAQFDAGAAVTGYISYQSDEDWFSFPHPCPGENCGIDFQWVQPGPSNVQVAFFMLNQDLSVHESFGYVGSTPTSSLSGPVSESFANANCTQCSFASSTATSTSGPYRYYLRIADVGQKSWDDTAKGEYSFKVTGVTPGCPSACSEGSPGVCGCYCAEAGACPAPTQ